jgi:methylase of polypeptide subunit release factors
MADDRLYPIEDVRKGVRETYRRSEPFDVELGDLSLTVHPRVFIPEPSTESILSSMRVSPGDDVLDMGCGTGALGIAAALRGASSVLLADKDAAAVANARDNVARCGVERQCDVIQSDCFAAVPRRAFDVVFFNGPFAFTREYDDALREVFEFGTAPPIDAIFDAGFATLDRFFREAPQHLKPTGYVHCAFHTGSNRDAFVDVIGRNGFSIERRSALPSGHETYELRVAS